MRPGLFKIQEVREALHPLLHPNVPRESWPDVEAEYGMVTYFFADGTKKDYLIFDAGDTVEPMFERARQNIVREDF